MRSAQLQAVLATAEALQRQQEIATALAQTLAAQVAQLQEPAVEQPAVGPSTSTAKEKVFPAGSRPRRTHFMEVSPDGDKKAGNQEPRRDGPQGRAKRRASRNNAG